MYSNNHFNNLFYLQLQTNLCNDVYNVKTLNNIAVYYHILLITERTTHVPFSLNAWREDSHQTLHFCRSGYWTLLQLLETLASPHLKRSGVSNCLKQIIYDWRHYWLFRSQHRNQYQKPLPSIQTTCSHRTRDLRVTLPVETRQYKTLYCTSSNTNQHWCYNTQYMVQNMWTSSSKNGFYIHLTGVETVFTHKLLVNP